MPTVCYLADRFILAKTATDAPTSEQPTKIAITGFAIMAVKAVPTQEIAFVMHSVIASIFNFTPPFNSEEHVANRRNGFQ